MRKFFLVSVLKKKRDYKNVSLNKSPKYFGRDLCVQQISWVAEAEARKKNFINPSVKVLRILSARKKMRNIFSILIITVKINDFKWSHKTSIQCTLKYVWNKFAKVLVVIFANTNKKWSQWNKVNFFIYICFANTTSPTHK